MYDLICIESRIKLTETQLKDIRIFALFGNTAAYNREKIENSELESIRLNGVHRALIFNYLDDQKKSCLMIYDIDESHNYGKYKGVTEIQALQKKYIPMSIFEKIFVHKKIAQNISKHQLNLIRKFANEEANHKSKMGNLTLEQRKIDEKNKIIIFSDITKDDEPYLAIYDFTSNEKLDSNYSDLKKENEDLEKNYHAISMEEEDLSILLNNNNNNSKKNSSKNTRNWPSQDIELSIPQNEARGMGMKTPLIINGPPGSGKTTVACKVVEDIFYLKKYARILYTTRYSYLSDALKKESELLGITSTGEFRIDFKSMVELQKINDSDTVIITDDEAKEVFENWFEFGHFNEKIKSSIKKIKSTEFKNIAGLVYEEMRLMHENITEEEYLSRGVRQSIFQDKNISISIYILYKSYKKYLDQNKKYDPAISSISKDNLDKYDFIIIDEAHSLSLNQLYFLIDLCKNKNLILLMNEELQNIDDPISKKQLAIAKIQKDKNAAVNQYYLPSIVYRSPKKIVKFLNYLEEVKLLAIGGASSKGSSELYSASKNDGEIIFIDPKNNNEYKEKIKNLADRPDVAFITSENNINKIIEKYNPALVFSSARSSGLQFPVVVIIGMRKNPRFMEFELNLEKMRLLERANKNEEVNRNLPKKISPNRDHSITTLINEIIVAAARAEYTLIIVDKYNSLFHRMIEKLSSPNISFPEVGEINKEEAFHRYEMLLREGLNEEAERYRKKILSEEESENKKNVFGNEKNEIEMNAQETKKNIGKNEVSLKEFVDYIDRGSAPSNINTKKFQQKNRGKKQNKPSGKNNKNKTLSQSRKNDFLEFIKNNIQEIFDFKCSVKDDDLQRKHWVSTISDSPVKFSRFIELLALANKKYPAAFIKDKACEHVLSADYYLENVQQLFISIYRCQIIGSKNKPVDLDEAFKEALISWLFDDGPFDPLRPSAQLIYPLMSDASGLLAQKIKNGDKLIRKLDLDVIFSKKYPFMHLELSKIIDNYESDHISIHINILDLDLILDNDHVNFIRLYFVEKKSYATKIYLRYPSEKNYISSTQVKIPNVNVIFIEDVIKNNFDKSLLFEEYCRKLEFQKYDDCKLSGNFKSLSYLNNSILERILDLEKKSSSYTITNFREYIKKIGPEDHYEKLMIDSLCNNNLDEKDELLFYCLPESILKEIFHTLLSALRKDSSIWHREIKFNVNEKLTMLEFLIKFSMIHVISSIFSINFKSSDLEEYILPSKKLDILKFSYLFARKDIFLFLLKYYGGVNNCEKKNILNHLKSLDSVNKNYLNLYCRDSDLIRRIRDYLLCQKISIEYNNKINKKRLEDILIRLVSIKKPLYEDIIFLLSFIEEEYTNDIFDLLELEFPSKAFKSWLHNLWHSYNKNDNTESSLVKFFELYLLNSAPNFKEACKKLSEGCFLDKFFKHEFEINVVSDENEIRRNILSLSMLGMAYFCFPDYKLNVYNNFLKIINEDVKIFVASLEISMNMVYREIFCSIFYSKFDKNEFLIKENELFKEIVNLKISGQTDIECTNGFISGIRYCLFDCSEIDNPVEINLDNLFLLEAIYFLSQNDFLTSYLRRDVIFVYNVKNLSGSEYLVDAIYRISRSRNAKRCKFNITFSDERCSKKEELDIIGAFSKLVEYLLSLLNRNSHLSEYMFYKNMLELYNEQNKASLSERIAEFLRCCQKNLLPMRISFFNPLDKKREDFINNIKNYPEKIPVIVEIFFNTFTNPDLECFIKLYKKIIASAIEFYKNLPKNNENDKSLGFNKN